MTSGTSLRVVLIDDNDMTRTLLRGILRTHARCDIVGEANNASMGLEVIKRHLPNVVFLDIEMPEGDGLDMLEQIRVDSPDTSVLMVTAHRERETVQTAISRGAAGYIVKPFTAARVLDALSAAAKSNNPALKMATTAAPPAPTGTSPASDESSPPTEPEDGAAG